ncbi:hypothetical protein WME79_15240 [Sorangium sp. So ce726]|uniref:hypothetical protein n=1 Tax=Sorangium sp. So ce726 TaxID=3133319 RepID=UPI003F5F9B5C
MKISSGCSRILQAVVMASALPSLAFAGNSAYYNWYFEGTPRGPEQGTHGTGMGHCPPSSVVNGVQYFDGGDSDWMDGIGVSCINLHTRQETYHNWYTGGVLGSEQGTHLSGGGKCPAGHVVNGVQYFGGGDSDWVDGIGLSCLRLSDGEVHSVNWYTGREPRGSEQGTQGSGMGMCPPGMVVTGIQYFEGGYSDWVDGLGVVCSDAPDSPASPYGDGGLPR